ncbi:hypothetical protein BKA66DRAFT_422749 [Pyrenochaeta sp. MPI-SDFR-AT-0127]|nr:hypothetical protein BKA66DRAFT_422749 [Pyrenochaeta sp. MPI-SDFR-AT-0127]
MALQPFFSDLIKVACNKTLLSLAARKNRQIMGRQRNAKVPVPDHGVLSRTRTRDVQAVEYTPEAKRARQLAGHQSMRLSSHSIISKDGKWICPCCQGKFTARESVIGHLVDEGLKKRICTLCSKPLDEGTKKNNFKQHINRHVDEGQICGINDCEAEMTSTTAMNRHRAAAHPEEVKSKLSSPCPRAMCRIVCSSDDALRKHLKAHQNPSVCCNWCGWQVTFKDLKRHKAKDCVKRPVAVAICPYEGCDEEIEMNHITRHIRNVHTKLADVMEMAEESDQHLLRAWADLIKRM